MSELKACRICGSKARPVYENSFTYEKVTGCSNLSCALFHVSVPVDEWNTRPLEDALLQRAEAAEKRADEMKVALDASAEVTAKQIVESAKNLQRAMSAEKVIRGMFPMWINAMGYCEHGKKDQLMAMRNYYNGRDNPMSNEDIHFMFSLIPDKDGD